MRPRAQDSLDWQDLLFLKKENYYYLNNKSASPTSPAASWPHFRGWEMRCFPTLGQLLIVSALRFPACRLGMPYLCENAMMSRRASLPPRLACAIVLRYLDIAALEGIMMRLGMVKTSNNFVYASSSESAYLHI